MESTGQGGAGDPVSRHGERGLGERVSVQDLHGASSAAHGIVMEFSGVLLYDGALLSLLTGGVVPLARLQAYMRLAQHNPTLSYHAAVCRPGRRREKWSYCSESRHKLCHGAYGRDKLGYTGGKSVNVRGVYAMNKVPDAVDIESSSWAPPYSTPEFWHPDFTYLVLAAARILLPRADALLLAQSYDVPVMLSLGPRRLGEFYDVDSFLAAAAGASYKSCVRAVLRADRAWGGIAGARLQEAPGAVDYGYHEALDYTSRADERRLYEHIGSRHRPNVTELVGTIERSKGYYLTALLEDLARAGEYPALGRSLLKALVASFLVPARPCVGLKKNYVEFLACYAKDELEGFFSHQLRHGDVPLDSLAPELLTALGDVLGKVTVSTPYVNYGAVRWAVKGVGMNSSIIFAESVLAALKDAYAEDYLKYLLDGYHITGDVVSAEEFVEWLAFYGDTSGLSKGGPLALYEALKQPGYLDPVDGCARSTVSAPNTGPGDNPAIRAMTRWIMHEEALYTALMKAKLFSAPRDAGRLRTLRTTVSVRKEFDDDRPRDTVNYGGPSRTGGASGLSCSLDALPLHHDQRMSINAMLGLADECPAAICVRIRRILIARDKNNGLRLEIIKGLDRRGLIEWRDVNDDSFLRLFCTPEAAAWAIERYRAKPPVGAPYLDLCALTRRATDARVVEVLLREQWHRTRTSTELNNPLRPCA